MKAPVVFRPRRNLSGNPTNRELRSVEDLCQLFL